MTAVLLPEAEPLYIPSSDIVGLCEALRDDPGCLTRKRMLIDAYLEMEDEDTAEGIRWLLKHNHWPKSQPSHLIHDPYPVWFRFDALSSHSGPIHFLTLLEEADHQEVFMLYGNNRRYMSGNLAYVEFRDFHHALVGFGKFDRSLLL